MHFKQKKNGKDKEFFTVIMKVKGTYVKRLKNK